MLDGDMLKNIILKVEYDGTNYAGWQKQKNALTIQEVIEKTIESVTHENCKVVGSSRTDAGVHARGFVCNFHTDSSIPPLRFKDALNTKLPQDIVILYSDEVSSDFNSRYDSKGKIYSYRILNRRERCAIDRSYFYLYKKHLNVDLMKKASEYLIGEHDFSAFKSAGSSAKTNVRKIYDIKIIRNDDIITFYVKGNGFLYNMVRIIVGTLIDVGNGKNEPDYVYKALISKNRELAGSVAPAKGLCLEKVIY